jgi:putative transposase
MGSRGTFAPEEFYHVYNRGTDKRKTFTENADCARFVHDLFEFNDTAHAPEYNRRAHVGHPMSHMREKLVDIHAWCLMPNHYHLLLSPRTENGIALFMKKVNMGYSKYFNEKYERTGSLWQGKYKKLLIERDAHFLYIPYYIHLNPLDLAFPEWREGKVRDAGKALAYLSRYRWSSHLDYLGDKNFPSLLQRRTLQGILGSGERYEREIANIIGDPEVASGSERIEYA